MTYVRMADAAFAQNIPPGFAVAAGYYGGPDAYHVWTRSDWGLFPGFKLPIWVPGTGDGHAEGHQAVAALQQLGVPRGSRTALDMETRNDRASVQLVADLGEVLQDGGYLVEVYGSASTVFSLPPLNGYWVADYTSDMGAIDQLLQHPGVRGVQFAANVPPGYDVSLVKAWTEGEMWHG